MTRKSRDEKRARKLAEKRQRRQGLAQRCTPPVPVAWGAWAREAVDDAKIFSRVAAIEACSGLRVELANRQALGDGPRSAAITLLEGMLDEKPWEAVSPGENWGCCATTTEHATGREYHSCWEVEYTEAGRLVLSLRRWLTQEAHRLEKFFELADLRCADCGEWHGDPAAWGLADEADWQRRMDRELAWIRSNARAVLEALPSLEEGWPKCCAFVRSLLGTAA